MASPQQCQGRIVRGRKVDGIHILPFETAEGKKPNGFHVPLRCDKVAAADERICLKCKERDERTKAILKSREGKSINNQDAYFHGYIGENPPDWSHAYGSKWFVDFVKKTGFGLSDSVKRRVEESLIACPGLPIESAIGPTLEMGKRVAEAVVIEKKKFAKVKKAAVVAVPEPVAVVPEPVAIVPEPVVAPVLEPMPEQKSKPAAKRRAPAKKAAATANTAATTAPSTPVAVVESAPLTGEFEVLQIPIRKAVIDERQVYLSSVKDKVYDLKFKYIGRYNRRADKIESQFPDTDEE